MKKIQARFLLGNRLRLFRGKTLAVAMPFVLPKMPWCAQVLPDLHLNDSALTTAILLHDNVLSCYVPRCGNATSSTSIIAIGNRLQHRNGEFPSWVSRYEHDPLFWVSGVEGVTFFRNLSGGLGFLMLAIAWALRSVGRQLSAPKS